ncbi:U-box domain-containing protein 52 [Acorus gramineus]|uniref:RING-type E3 ubiquitin transferase n=1 Tax=Acorus gramineus TaxID=55184 RepID=A0AAV9A313_ACOGR|nr:U-box domain-containing protein 52 [Acorus gramineus]
MHPHGPPPHHQPHPSDEERHPLTITSAVAIDKDKNSQHAFKWAADNLMINSPYVALIHVRHRHVHHGFTMTEASFEATREQMEAEQQHLYLPYRNFCSRKGIHLKEVVLDDSDVTKAIVDYVNANSIHNIVVGASTRNALTRKLRNHDIPGCLMRAAPDFCTVYVISKGKAPTVRSARAAPSPPPNSGPPWQPTALPHSHHFPDDIGHEDSVRRFRTPFGRGPRRSPALVPSVERRSMERNNDYTRTPGRERPLSNARAVHNNVLFDDLEHPPPVRPTRSSLSHDSFPDDIDFHGNNLGSQSMDFGSDSLSFISSESPKGGSYSPLSSVKAEMKRLRLELKQTMDMYSTACKEAITAKQKARELHQWKLEEARKFEEARHAEEAALAMAEMEKAKARAALEAAEAAQRLAEVESQKRMSAEMKAKRETEEKKRVLDALAHTDVRYRRYSIEEIENATNFFADTQKIGEGGYGPVYGASLDHTPVAIKVLRPDAAQGRKQFQQEVEVLSCIRHPNMVLLLGACPEYGCLVYEYMDNGSLDDRLFRRGNTPPIPWPTRFKIAAEIATGLLFLHQTKPEPLVHRDLKPGNILLDRNYVSKISDVGLARLVPPSMADSVTQYRMTSTAGTFCYIDPEYQQTGMLGIKSDIYSLGILLLQLITAKPPMGLTHHVERAIERGTFADMLDHTVTEWPVEEAFRYAKMALKCSELRRKDRPDLGGVILPELNRLRNLGQAYSFSLDVGSGGNGGDSCYSGYFTGGPNSIISRTRASTAQVSM